MVPDPSFWVLLIRAASEAAVIGGLADWFAVTALFRHPLGLPIPHTALVPRNKDRIGQALARFLRDNFLDPAVLADRLKGRRLTLGVSQWLDPASEPGCPCRAVDRCNAGNSGRAG